MIDFSKELNEEQYRVVTAEPGPLLVIAGAGSGKTRTLTYRVAWLLEKGVPPDSILLATFTNKAARSMLSRVEGLVGEQAREVWGGTFHSLGNRILRRHARRMGYESNYSILDRDDAQQLVASSIVEAGITTKSDRFPKAAQLLDIISLAANTSIPLEKVLLERFPSTAPFVTDILKVAFRYRLRKQELNVMDFDDLLLKWYDLLAEHDDIREEYAEKFQHILVDEYQDTNIIQAKILDLLSSRHGNIMVVGDDSQSIYSFRGADYRNILSFPKRYAGSRMFKLETNYRSTPPILNLANLSIINNQRQYEKQLRAVRSGGVRPVYAPLVDASHQADFVVRRILELADEGVPLDEIAVLYRAHHHAMELQMELVRQDIPFVVRSGIRFFEQAHIKDMNAYLRLAANPCDELAWRRVLGLYGGIGKARAGAIWEKLAAGTDPRRHIFSEEIEVGLSKTALPGLRVLRSNLKRLFEAASGDDPGRTIETMLTEGGYGTIMRDRYDNFQSREEDLRQLAEFSRRFESLHDFLTDLALMTNLDDDKGMFPEDRRNGWIPGGKVVLSTIHQAKGLEWSVVFMIRCSEGCLPLSRALREPGGEDEERRLFYVAATRAKDRLYLCHAVNEGGRGGWSRSCAPSRFINELAYSCPSPGELPFEQWDGYPYHRVPGKG